MIYLHFGIKGLRDELMPSPASYINRSSKPVPYDQAFTHYLFPSPLSSAEASLCHYEAGERGKESAQGMMMCIFPFPIIHCTLTFFFFFLHFLLEHQWQPLRSTLTFFLPRLQTPPVCRLTTLPTIKQQNLNRIFIIT